MQRLSFSVRAFWRCQERKNGKRPVLSFWLKQGGKLPKFCKESKEENNFNLKSTSLL